MCLETIINCQNQTIRINEQRSWIQFLGSKTWQIQVVAQRPYSGLSDPCSGTVLVRPYSGLSEPCSGTVLFRDEAGSWRCERLAWTFPDQDNRLIVFGYTSWHARSEHVENSSPTILQLSMKGNLPLSLQIANQLCRKACFYNVLIVGFLLQKDAFVTFDMQIFLHLCAWVKFQETRSALQMFVFLTHALPPPRRWHP